MVTDDTPAIYRSLAKNYQWVCALYFIKVRGMDAPLSVSAFIVERVPMFVVALIMHCLLTSTTIHNSLFLVSFPDPFRKIEKGSGNETKTKLLWIVVWKRD